MQFDAHSMPASEYYHIFQAVSLAIILELLLVEHKAINYTTKATDIYNLNFTNGMWTEQPFKPKNKNNNFPFCEPQFAHVLELELSFAYTVSVVHQNNVKFKNFK